NISAGDEVIPFLDHGLAGLILGMRFARENQLHWTFLIREDADQTFGIMKEQVGTLISCEPARETNHQRLRIENGFGLGNFLSRRSLLDTLSRKALARILDKRLARFRTQFPELFVAYIVKALDILQRSAPAILAALLSPEFVRVCRIPGRYVNAVRYRANRHFELWPSRKETLENLPAHSAMELAYSIDTTAPPQSEICHVERLGTVERAFSSQGHQLFEIGSQLVLGVFSEVLFH